MQSMMRRAALAPAPPAPRMRRAARAEFSGNQARLRLTLAGRTPTADAAETLMRAPDPAAKTPDAQPAVADVGTPQAEPQGPPDVCRKQGRLYGWDSIRNISRERLRAKGFVFCGPDRDQRDPDLWERWVHPVEGLLHFQVRWKDDPAPEPDKPPAKDDRQQRCGDPCTSKFDNEADCKQCCEDTIPADDTRCRRTCDVACSLLL